MVWYDISDMEEVIMKGTLIFAQSGGPTAVINASAAGVFTEALKNVEITRVLGARYGIDGVLAEDFVDISTLSEEDLQLLRVTPASALGSCRHKLADPEVNDAEYRQLLELFKKHDVRYFIYNGGNDSMDTCNKISRFLAAENYPCCVVGVPKTVDNDLVGTDHCPGFGSAAKFIATTCHELSIDTAVYKKGRVTVVEIMGRDAGWLTASSALASVAGAGVDLIYLPERAFDLATMAESSKAILQKKGSCLVAVSEGIRDANGRYIGATATGVDSFGHVQLGGVAYFLAEVLTKEYGLKTRAIELSLPQRSSGHIASKTDNDEAFTAGVEAVKAAVRGESGVMVSMKRVSGEKYDIEFVTVDLGTVANDVSVVPDEYISDNGDNVTAEFIQYALPLIQGECEVEFENGLPRYLTMALR
jgi:6-phosphofructokinase 1